MRECVSWRKFGMTVRSHIHLNEFISRTVSLTVEVSKKNRCIRWFFCTAADNTLDVFVRGVGVAGIPIEPVFKLSM